MPVRPRSLVMDEPLSSYRLIQIATRKSKGDREIQRSKYFRQVKALRGAGKLGKARSQFFLVGAGLKRTSANTNPLKFDAICFVNLAGVGSRSKWLPARFSLVSGTTLI